MESGTTPHPSLRSSPLPPTNKYTRYQSSRNLCPVSPPDPTSLSPKPSCSRWCASSLLVAGPQREKANFKRSSGECVSHHPPHHAHTVHGHHRRRHPKWRRRRNPAIAPRPPPPSSLVSTVCGELSCEVCEGRRRRWLMVEEVEVVGRKGERRRRQRGTAARGT